MIAGIFVAFFATTFAFFLLSDVEEKVVVLRRKKIALGIEENRQFNLRFEKEKILRNADPDTDQRALAKLLFRADLKIRLWQAYLFMVCFGGVVAFIAQLFLGSLFISLLLGGFSCTVIPRFILGILISKRESQFLDQFPDALDLISRGLRAGMTFITCLKQVAETMQDPLRSEFINVLDLQKIGVPLPDAIKRMPERMDILDLRFFSVVIEIQQKTGGNLSEILENLSHVIRGRKEMRAKIRALISEAKVSSIIIGVIPILFAILSWYSDPDAFSKFWTERIGQIMMGICAFLYIAGVLIFIKIATIKI